MKLHFSLFIIILLAIRCVPPTEEVLTDINIDFKDKTLQRLYIFQDQLKTDSLFQFLRLKDPTYRYMSAMAMASIKDVKTLDSLEVLLNDPIDEVRTAAAYAIGQIGEPASEDKLIAAFDQFDSLSLYRNANAAILEAVGKSASDKYLSALSSITTYEHSDTILLEGQAWGLYRYALRGITSKQGTERMVALATTRAYPTSVRVIAGNYLYRAKNIRLETYDNILADALAKEDDPLVRMTLAIAVGKTKTEVAETALITQFGIERDPRVKCNIIRAFNNFEYDKVAPSVWQAVEDKNLQVAQTAVTYFLENGNSRDASNYWRKAKDTSLVWQVQTELYKAANRNMPVFFADSKKFINWELKRKFDTSTNPYEKAAAVRAVGEYGWNYRWIKQFAFPSNDPVVRTASIEAIDRICRIDNFRKFFGEGYRRVRKELSSYLVEAIENGDAGMMAIAAGTLREPSLFFKGTVDSIAFLENALTDLDLPREIETYNEVKQTLEYFQDKKITPPLKPEFNHPIDWITFNEMKKDAKAVFQTSKGEITIQLMPQKAPGSVVNFVRLIKNGFYNNKVFHRVVPNFVIQGGCPRGDGYGSLDYTIRSELPYLHYNNEGYVGMASAGNHTEGTQFFITHSPTPHLDGNYTIFGKVTDGMDVVQQIGVGDVIESVELK